MRNIMNFENLSQTWQNQHNLTSLPKTEAVVATAKQKMSNFKKEQLISISVLSLTFLILVVFYFSIGAHQNISKSLGLVLMIFMLFTRIALEIRSKIQLHKMDSTLNFKDFVSKHKRYFQNRKWIHFVFSPFIYLFYVGGFVSMLPVFKETLSTGFFLYIQISGIVVFVALALFIAYHIKKELQELQFLNEVLRS